MSKKKIIPQGNVYGYLRVSTEKQAIDNNKNAILKFKEENNLVGPITWVEEKISGLVPWNNRELGKLLNNSSPGDVIIISELSRISRSSMEIVEFLSTASKKGIVIRSLDIKFPLDGSVMANMYVNGIALCAQIERDSISMRTKIALQKRKDEGVILGRPIGRKNSNGGRLFVHKDKIESLIKSGVKLKKIAEDYKVSRQTLSIFIKEHNLKQFT